MGRALRANSFRATGDASLDEAASNLLRSLIKIRDDESDGEESPRTFNFRMREAASSGASFHASPQRRRARVRAEDQAQSLMSASMPDLSGNAIPSSAAGRGGPLRYAGQNILQQDASEQSNQAAATDLYASRQSFGGASSASSTMRSTMQSTMRSTDGWVPRNAWPLRRRNRGSDERQVQFDEDVLGKSMDGWDRYLAARDQARLTNPVLTTSSNVAGSDVEQELQSLKLVHARTVEELAKLNNQLDWTQGQLQQGVPEPKHKAKQYQDEVVKLRVELSEAAADRDLCKAQLSSATEQREDLAKLRSELTVMLAERQNATEQNEELVNVQSELSCALAESHMVTLGTASGALAIFAERQKVAEQKEELVSLRLELSTALAEKDKATVEASNESRELIAAELVSLRLELSTALAEKHKATVEDSNESRDKGQGPELIQQTAELNRLRLELSKAMAEKSQMQEDKCRMELLLAKPDAHAKLRIGLSQALAERDMSRNELQQFLAAQCQQNEDFNTLRSELEMMYKELMRAQDEVGLVRQQGCAAQMAEDELPKVLEYCSRQETLLVQLQKDFLVAQEQLLEKSKALDDINMRGNTFEFLGGELLASAYTTLRSMKSANTSLRSTMRDTKTFGDQKSNQIPWAQEGASATWGDWKDSLPKGKRERRHSNKGGDRMSRSMVSFQLEEQC